MSFAPSHTHAEDLATSFMQRSMLELLESVGHNTDKDPIRDLVAIGKVNGAVTK